ncbi:protein adenylyltransferase SelO [Flavobacterium sp. RSSA_27]|uniref:protein adenylyltransferase SelO n=1 Tax=Flavobacterium sp. RSSA_27 TaxID=3447667 RepID=UPI003F2AC577
MQVQLASKFVNELPADPEKENGIRQVYHSCYSIVFPKKPSNPKLIHANTIVANLLGIATSNLDTEEFVSLFSGEKTYPNAQPFAMCYAGHQFGNWAGQLGDGRAINLMEVTHDGKDFTLQLKGAGPTPYSRNADGLAVLRSSIREYLCAEAMHHLGIPTTRSLSLLLTGDEVLRDVMYDGNPAYEKGAIVCRVAPSFIRFGNFELFAARQDHENLKRLADFTIRHYFQSIKKTGKEKYIQFFEAVSKSTLEMILHWQRVGFVHGVMNTDNMSIHGLTIDYGPYGWMDDYNPAWTPNTTDKQHRRYRFENQPQIGLWNLYQLANALYPLIEETQPLEAILDTYTKAYDSNYLQMMQSKLGFQTNNEDDRNIIQELIVLLQEIATDMTIFFRNLSVVLKNDTPETAFKKIEFAFYNANDCNENIALKWHNWFTKYSDRLQLENVSDAERSNAMNQVNPKYVLRNYMAQLCIDAAEKGDYTLLNELYELLQNPYQEQPEYEKWYAKRPDWAKDKIGCSMLSCSS